MRHAGGLYSDLCPHNKVAPKRAMRTRRGSRDKPPVILNLNTNWRWVVSYTLRLLYPCLKTTGYTLSRRLARLQIRSGRLWRREKHGIGQESNPGLLSPRHTWCIDYAVRPSVHWAPELICRWQTGRSMKLINNCQLLRPARWIFRKWDVGVWSGSSWLRIGTGGGHLWMQ